MPRPLHETISRSSSALMFCICSMFAVCIVGVLGLVLLYLFKIGAGSFSLSFFTELPTGRSDDPGGMRHALIGTGIMVGLASLVGIPVGLFAGIYLSEYASDRFLPGPVRFVADVLAGVPSIVVGILGYELIVVPMGQRSGWAGALALAFIMIPIVARTTEEMLRLVPQSYREGSLALGATKSQTILRVVVPAATGSVVTGILLAIARVAGETAPLLFTTALAPFVQTNPGEKLPSLTVAIFEYSRSPEPAMRDLAWTGMLVLVTLLLVLSAAIRFLASRSVKGAR